jgi:hypothetical protein
MALGHDRVRELAIRPLMPNNGRCRCACSCGSFACSLRTWDRPEGRAHRAARHCHSLVGRA